MLRHTLVSRAPRRAFPAASLVASVAAVMTFSSPASSLPAIRTHAQTPSSEHLEETPVLTDTGELPELEPGVVHVFRPTGTIADVDEVSDTALRIVAPVAHLRKEVALTIESSCPTGENCTIRTSQVEHTPSLRAAVLHSQGTTTVSAYHHLPDSTVHVWLVSPPVFLGSSNVDADGTTTISDTPSGLPPGNYTLQVNGTALDGTDYTVNMGVVLVADNPLMELPDTGLTAIYWFPALLVSASGWVLIRWSSRRSTLHASSVRSTPTIESGTS